MLQWLKNIWQIIINPRIAFSRIVADGDLEGSMFRAFIYGMLGGALVLGIRLLGGATLTLSSVFLQLIVVPVIAVALLFLLGGVMMLITEISGGQRDWEIAVAGLASVFFVYPIMLVLNALAWNCTSLMTVSIVIDAYVLFLLYNIAVYCMKASRGRALAICVILLIFLITIYATDYRMGWLMLKNSGAALKCII
ncbi:MAG: hypothetical protein LBO08_01145 [Rickettsiales bacterium]|jgi:hypothetical protein|nr:hypothetical protein [Rickettsiales bacterium]